MGKGLASETAVRPAILTSILSRFQTIRHRFEEVWHTERTILAVTPFAPERRTLHLFSLEQSWHISYAGTLCSAIELSKHRAPTVILYDRNTPGVDWTKAASVLTRVSGPVCFILLSETMDARLWRAVLEHGGYDVARKPLERNILVPLVNGACRLSGSIDCVEALSHYVV